MGKYHYCKVSTFESILQSKVLFLSPLVKSNDTDDIIYIFNQVWQDVKDSLAKSDLDKNNLQEILKILDGQYNLYTKIFSDEKTTTCGICFSANKDSNWSWQEYADAYQGIALEFDLDWFKIKYRTVHPSANFESTVGIVDAIYDYESIIKELSQICYQTIKNQPKNALIWLNIQAAFTYYSSIVKNASFEEDNETRIVIAPSFMKEHCPQNIYQISGPYVTPFYHYCIPWYISESDNALISVNIGPYCKISQKDVRTMLIKYGLSTNIQVEKSKSTYRKR